MIKNNSDIIIVGSGTAGLTTALILKTRFQNFNIKVISSSKIGIIGVGEGCTEHWKTFMNYVGITTKDIVENTDATIKLAIRFQNWMKEDYFHYVSYRDLATISKYIYNQASIISKNLPNKYIVDPSLFEGKIHAKTIEDSNYDVSNQFHFDTFKLNNYLKKLCLKENIELIEDEIKDVSFNEQGEVNKLICVNNNYTGDLYIDASGFARTIFKKIKEAQWISYKKYLPLDRAFAFPTELDENVKFSFYTLSRALKYGWNWHIPTQSRTGNGYVFSSSHISDDQAVDEISELYGKQITPAKFFKIEAGRYEKCWIKNVVAIGISSSFVEPLEATSITSTIQQAFALTDYLPSEDKDSFNKHYDIFFDNVIDFIQLHYFVDKNETSFWRDQKNSIEWRDGVLDKINIAKKRLLLIDDFPFKNGLFSAPNWNCVLYGLGLFNIDAIKKEFEVSIPDWLLPQVNQIIDYKLNYKKYPLVKEKELIKYLLNNK